MSYPPEGGCPPGTLGYKYSYTNDSGSLVDAGYTCICEDHCAWDRCHLLQPPTKCLVGQPRVWKWDAENVHWVALGISNKIFLFALGRL